MNASDLPPYRVSCSVPDTFMGHGLAVGGNDIL